MRDILCFACCEWLIILPLNPRRGRARMPAFRRKSNFQRGGIPTVLIAAAAIDDAFDTRVVSFYDASCTLC